MFSKEPRCIYSRNQLAEVICQLRFPEILAIAASSPVKQEIIMIIPQKGRNAKIMYNCFNIKEKGYISPDCIQ